MTEASRVGVLLTQEGHGFNRGQAVTFDGANWALADTGSEGVGLVGSLLSSNTFEFVTHGELDGLTGLIPGAAYYIEDGELTTTASGLSVGFALSETSLFVQTVSIGTVTGSATGFGGGAGQEDAFDHAIFATKTEMTAAVAAEEARADAAYLNDPGEEGYVYRTTPNVTIVKSAADIQNDIGLTLGRVIAAAHCVHLR